MWEYKVFAVSRDSWFDAEKTLNILGKDGWELVSVLPATSQCDKVVYYLKRRKTGADGK